MASRTRDDLVEILEVMGLLLVHGLRQLALRGSDRDLAGLLSPGMIGVGADKASFVVALLNSPVPKEAASK